MDSQTTPPIPSTPTPTPSLTPQRPSYGTKILNIALICLILIAGTFTVGELSDSRERNAKQVGSSIASSWGGNTTITGPLISSAPDTNTYVSPLRFDCKANIKITPLHRGIYHTEAYDADVKASSTYSKSDLSSMGETVWLNISAFNSKIKEIKSLTVNGRDIKWTKSFKNELSAEIHLSDMPEIFEIEAQLSLKGSEQFMVKDIGGVSSITIEGDASNPSFSADHLPSERTVTDNTFSAHWEGQGDSDSPYVFDCPSLGVNFLTGVDGYQKVYRTIRYAFIIIILTFICVFFIEVQYRRNIPLLNYFLIGSALVLFYSLLLSITEHLGFGIGYMISAVMTVALISCYVWRMLNSRKASIALGCILAGIYFACYIMLNATDYALLFGSFLLFFALAIVMYGSLKINR